MELSWTTFILEIINFLVLVWILKHFFYAPIQKVILARKKMVDDSLDNANKMQLEAKQLRETYENRLQDWGKEKAQKQKLFLQEIDQWKTQEHEKFLKTLSEEKEKQIALEKQNSFKLIKRNAKESMFLAGKFAAKFLSEFADESLEHKIIAKMITDLKSLSEQKRQIFLNGFQNEHSIAVQTAFELNETLKKQLTECIQQISNENTEINFIVNAELMAGANLQMGSIVLKANLRDELKFFSEVEGEIT